MPDSINENVDASGTVADVTVADAMSDVKTTGLKGLPLTSITNSELAPVGSEVLNGVPVLSARKNENSSGTSPIVKFVSSASLNDMVEPKVTPWFHSLRNAVSLSIRGPGVSVPDTAPLVVALPNAASLAKTEMVALLLKTKLPPIKSRITKPDCP